MIPTCSTASRYQGWIIARTNSAATEMTTTEAQPHSQRPHDEDALSMASSVAFITPWRSRHTGNEFWMGLAWGALVSAIVIAVFLTIGLYLQWQP